MASEGAPPVRHMGSIEDPSVHEPAAVPDGAGDHNQPEALRPSVAPPAPAEAQETSSEAELRRTGHPVRDRMLARAREARLASDAAPLASRSAGSGSTGSGSTGSGSTGSVESELLKVASSAGPGLPLRLNGAPLSSLSVLLLGTVFGLAAFALLFALLIEFAPVRPSGQASAVLVEPESATSVDAPVASVSLPPPPPPRKRIPGPWRIGAGEPGKRVLRGSIGKDPFLRAIQDAGLDKTQAYRVYTALKGEKDLDHCRPSDEFVALLDKHDGRVVAFEYIVSREEIYQARQGSDGLLTGKQLDLSVKRARVQGSLVIRVPSFAENATASHFDPGLGAIINKAIEGHLTVDDFKIGDRLRVVAQEVTVLGEFSRYAGLEALEYIPAQGDPIRVYYFENKKRYYDAKGRAPGEEGFRKPVPGAPITSHFNPKRMHPILKKIMPHNGTDFGAPTGTPVFASAAGTIKKLGNYGPNGNFIGIQHWGGYETGYSHLSRFEPGLKVGDKVKRLQPIGYVGTTGRSTGPHLHFSAKKDGKFIDAETLGLDQLTTMPKDELALFHKVKQKYDVLLDEIPLPPPVAGVAPPAASSADTDPDFAEQDDESDGAGQEALAGAALAAPADVSAAPADAPAAPMNAPAAAENVASGVPAAAAHRTGSLLYMSDKELMQSQSRVDDGEVDQ